MGAALSDGGIAPEHLQHHRPRQALVPGEAGDTGLFDLGPHQVHHSRNFRQWFELLQQFLLTSGPSGCWWRRRIVGIDLGSESLALSGQQVGNQGY
jgi:hypothetical protein